MGAIFQIIIAVVIISAIVGAVAQFLGKLNEQQNNPSPRRVRHENTDRAEGGAARQSINDVDRFLAEIERLRQRNGGGGRPPIASPVTQPAVTVARPTRRVKAVPVAAPIAALTEPPRRRPDASTAYDIPPSPIYTPSASPTMTGSDLPVATVLTPSTINPGQPTTFVTSLPPSLSAPVNPVTPRALASRRVVANPQTDFAKNLAALLGSTQGVSMALALKEIFGPPKSKANGEGRG